MNPFGIADFSYSQLLHTLQQFPEVEKAVIFGSRAKGNYRNGSDVDIALYGPETLEKVTLRISAILNQELPVPYQFDILNYNHLNHPQLKEHIDQEGKVFYQNNS